MKRSCIILLLLTVSAATLASPRSSAQESRPNIVLVMADDQGWGDTAYNGHPLIQTPNLDAMASVGLRFDRFYAAAPVCSPTRGSVLTGRNPNRFACFSWGRPLRPQEITIAERLRDVGYATGHFGKWHLGSVLKGSPVNPGNSGFDEWVSAFNFYDNDPILSDQGTATELVGESSVLAADAAIEFMRRKVDEKRPFLAVVWFGSPHSPHRAADEDRALYGDHPQANWMGEITGLDRAVGKVRAALSELGIRDNTLLWYTSDNGGLFPSSSGGRDKKGSIYEGGLRVPAIVEWPDRIATPRVSAMPATTCDIYPTIMEIVDVQIDDQPRLDGQSLVPVFDGQQAERMHPIGFWNARQSGIGTPSDKWMREELSAQRAGREYHDRSRLVASAGEISTQYDAETVFGHAAWLDWPWKLHRINGPQNRPGETQWELYNLENDPMETTDVREQNAEIAGKMQVGLAEWYRSVIVSLNGGDY